jgi:MEMO1 family protein
MASIRPAAVAGSFYPSAAQELSALLDDCFQTSPLGPQGIGKLRPALVAGMVPHAGPVYSGPCAAHFYSCLKPSIQTVILLGVNHSAKGHRAALSPWRSWQTPLGEVAIDQPLSGFLQARVKFLEPDDTAHADEHSIEIQLPFLQRVLGEFTLVPISLSHLSVDECADLGAAIAAAHQAVAKPDANTIIIASSDLSHYLSPSKTAELDGLALNQVLRLDPNGLLQVVEDNGISMCGVLPAAVMLFTANELGVRRASLLKHCHSGDVSSMRKVVGYASVALEL